MSISYSTSASNEYAENKPRRGDRTLFTTPIQGAVVGVATAPRAFFLRFAMKASPVVAEWPWARLYLLAILRFSDRLRTTWVGKIAK